VRSESSKFLPRLRARHRNEGGLVVSKLNSEVTSRRNALSLFAFATLGLIVPATALTVSAAEAQQTPPSTGTERRQERRTDRTRRRTARRAARRKGREQRGELRSRNKEEKK
jgi:hypothetical protein